MEKAFFSSIRNELISSLRMSKTEIKIAVAWFTSIELYDVLIERLKNNVEVTLIIIDDYINSGEYGLDFQTFIDCKGKLYYGKTENPMHHKFCIIDDDILFTGSYNWTYFAENKNCENIVKFDNNKSLIDSFALEFERLVTELNLVTSANKITYEEFEIKNLFAIQNYMAMDLLYRAKELKEIEFVENAKKFIGNNELIKKEYEALKQMISINDSFQNNIFRADRPHSYIPKKITRNSIGIKSRIDNIDGKFSIIIPKGTTSPCELSHIYHTVSDNQTQMSIETFKGENDFAESNTRLGKFLINDLPKKPKGEASVEITIKLDSTHNLIVIAKSVDTGNRMEANYYDKLLVM